MDSGSPQSVYALDTSAMTQLGLESLIPGDTWTLPEGAGSVEFTGFERWSSFQIAQDPGKELALLASIAAMAGLMLSLFVRRRRIWVKVLAPPGAATVVQVAGLTRSSSLDDIDLGALTDDIDALVREISRAEATPKEHS